MMKKTMLCIILGFVLLSQTGCWSRTEMNEIAIAAGLGIDTIGDQYQITVQVVDPTQVASKAAGGGSYTPIVIYTEKGRSLAEAIGRLSTIIPRKIYFSHLFTVVLSEEVVKKEGITFILDFLSRSHVFRNDFYFGIAKGTTARELLSVLSSLEKIPSHKMFQTLEIAQKEWSPVSAKHLDEMVIDLYSEGQDLVLNGFILAGQSNKKASLENLQQTIGNTKIKLYGLAAFKQNKFVGWMNETESRGYTNLTDTLKKTVLVSACEDKGTVSFEVIRSKTNIKANILNNGKIEIHVDSFTEADILSAECEINVTDPNIINELETKAAQEIKHHSLAAIKKAKALQADVFGFGEVVRRKHPKYWKKIKKNWAEEFVNASIIVDPVVKIRRIGSIGDSISSEISER